MVTYQIFNDYYLLGPYTKYLVFAWCMLMEWLYWNRPVLDNAIITWVHPPYRRRLLREHFGIIEEAQIV
jgi:hypothetical protein